MPFAWAGAIAAGVSAVTGVAGALSQSDAVSGGQASANQAQEAGLTQARADLEPWRTQGANALGITSNLSGANGPEAAGLAQKDFFTSPGYDFRLSEGLRAVDAGAAAKGMLRSGATLKGEMAFGQGLASDEFSSYYNRLFDLSKLGESAAAGSADASQKTGAGIAQTDAAAAGAQSDIFGNAVHGINSTVNALGNNQNLFPANTGFVANEFQIGA